MIGIVVVFLIFGGLLLFVQINYLWFNLFPRFHPLSVLGWFIVNTTYLVIWHTIIMKTFEYTDII